MGANSLPKTVTRQCHGCDLNPGPSASESSTLTTWLPSHPIYYVLSVLWMTSYLHVMGHVQQCWWNTVTASQPDDGARQLGHGLCLFVNVCLSYTVETQARMTLLH